MKISKCQELKRECDLVYCNKKLDFVIFPFWTLNPDFITGHPGLVEKTPDTAYCSAYNFNHFLRIENSKFTALFTNKVKITQYQLLFVFRLFRKMGVPKFYRYMSERYPCLSQVSNKPRRPAAHQYI